MNPTATNGAIDALDIKPIILHGLDAVRDLDDLARGGIGIGEGTIGHEHLHAATRSSFPRRASRC
jgi:hypothetical protein